MCYEYYITLTNANALICYYVIVLVTILCFRKRNVADFNFSFFNDNECVNYIIITPYF